MNQQTKTSLPETSEPRLLMFYVVFSFLFSSLFLAHGCSSESNAPLRSAKEAQSTGSNFLLSHPTQTNQSPHDPVVFSSALPETQLHVLSHLDEEVFSNQNLKALPLALAPKLPSKRVVFRSYTGAYHFYSLDREEGTTAGFTFEGPAFELFDYALRGMIAVFRCYNNSAERHFLSTQSNCGSAQFKMNGIMGYLWQSSQKGSAPLFQCYLSTQKASLTTTNSSECIKNKYQVSATLGYL